MKIRNGFVSNSSSSSFIIRKSDVDLCDLKKFMADSKVDENYILMNEDKLKCIFYRVSYKQYILNQDNSINDFINFLKGKSNVI